MFGEKKKVICFDEYWIGTSTSCQWMLRFLASPHCLRVLEMDVFIQVMVGREREDVEGLRAVVLGGSGRSVSRVLTKHE